MKNKIPNYAYKEQLLINRMNDCKTIEELVEIGSFYSDMEAQNLIVITARMKIFCQVKQSELIFRDKLNRPRN